MCALSYHTIANPTPPSVLNPSKRYGADPSNSSRPPELPPLFLHIPCPGRSAFVAVPVPPPIPWVVAPSRRWYVCNVVRSSSTRRPTKTSARVCTNVTCRIVPQILVKYMHALFCTLQSAGEICYGFVQRWIGVFFLVLPLHGDLGLWRKGWRDAGYMVRVLLNTCHEWKIHDASDTR